MAENVRKIGEKQTEAAIAALLTTTSILEAASKLGCSPRTIHRYLKNESFKAAYREARSQLLNAAINLLKASSLEAVTGLKEIGKDSQASSSARVTAWRSILEFALRGDEQENIKEKLAELESNLANEGASEGWPSNV